MRALQVLHMICVGFLWQKSSFAVDSFSSTSLRSWSIASVIPKFIQMAKEPFMFTSMLIFMSNLSQCSYVYVVGNIGNLALPVMPNFRCMTYVIHNKTTVTTTPYVNNGYKFTVPLLIIVYRFDPV